MAKIFRNKVLFAKAEVTYGTDPTPVGTDAVLTSALSIEPYQGNVVERDFDRNTLGASTSINTGPFVTITFEVEIAGAGGVDTVPAYDALLKACGFGQTVNAGVSVQYDPVSTSFGSVTLYVELDGEQHRITGCRGNVSFDLSTSQIPKMTFTMTGLYSKPQAATLTPDTSDYGVPLPVTQANTGTFTFDGYAFCVQGFNFDMGNQVNYRNLVNCEAVTLSDRSVTGNLIVESELLATKDVYALLESHSSISTAVLDVVHGSVGGNIIEIDAPTVQVNTLSHSDSDGILMYNLGITFVPSATGNDEVRYTTR